MGPSAEPGSQIPGQYTLADYVKQRRKLEDTLAVASLLTPSPVGDLLGVASDAAHMINVPEDRTPTYLAGALLGAIPGIPASIAKHAVRLFPAVRVRARDAAGRLTGELNTLPGQWGGMHFQIAENPPKPYTLDSIVDDWHSDGFLDEAGKYYDRGEAAGRVRMHYPGISLLDPKGTALTSEDLLELYELPKPFYTL